MIICSINNEIEEWDKILAKNNQPKLIESAFFNIYIQLEIFIREQFIYFALGNSVGSYIPDRKLEFNSENQLFEIIRGDNRFVDYFSAIQRCGDHIFVKNPFNLIFNSTNYHDDLLKMKHIRDFIAHKSSESRGRYINKVLNTYGIQNFILPGDFLSQKLKNKKYSYYSNYCNKTSEICSILLNDKILLNI